MCVMASSSPRPRRQYGTGGLSLRDDGRWMGRIDAGYTPAGKRRQITVYGRTEAEAKTKLDRKRAQIAREGVSVSTGRMSLRTWCEKWLTARSHTQRPKAYAADAYSVRTWIVPTIGVRRLENLTPADIRAVAAAQRDAGKAPSTAVRTHRVLLKLLRDAILEGHDVPQRVLLTPAPTAGTSNRDALLVEDAVAILGQAALLPHGSRWATALLQGMRPGECLGLRWDAVDFTRGLITVSWQLQQLPYLDKHDRSRGFRLPDGYDVVQLDRALHLVRPKSKAGWRVIPMIPWTRQALEAWRTAQTESALPNPHDLVWPRNDGQPRRAVDDREEWFAVQGAAGLDRWTADEQASRQPRGLGHPAGRYYVPHEARHTTATLLLEAGVDTAVIQAILGQSSIVATRGYQHVRTHAAAAALTEIAGRLQLSAT